MGFKYELNDQNPITYLDKKLEINGNEMFFALSYGLKRRSNGKGIPQMPRMFVRVFHVIQKTRFYFLFVNFFFRITKLSLLNYLRLLYTLF